MANSTTNTQETRQFPLPSIKISYSGSGVRFLRILGWVNIGIFCLMGILLLFGAIDLFGFAGLGIFGLVVLISFPTLLLLLAFVSLWRRSRKTLLCLKQYWNPNMIFVRIVDIETEAMENVCRVIQRPVTIKNPPAHHLMTGRGRSERIYRH